MMELTLKRKFKGKCYTIGDLYTDGLFFSNVIEDVVRELPATCPDTAKGLTCKCRGKKYAETAIPPGRYKITMEYRPKYKRILPNLHNVPHFLGILIHSGNTEKDSAGCLIVGMNTVKGRVTDSRATSDKLNEILSPEKEIYITVD